MNGLAVSIHVQGYRPSAMGNLTAMAHAMARR
jgi:hypothetical protein